MMRFKLFVGLLLCAFAVHGASPQTCYHTYRQEILAGTCLCFEETFFAVGKATVCVDSPRAIKNAKRKAALSAQAHLIAYCRLEQAPLPETLTSEERAQIVRHALPFISSAEYLRGVQQVDTFIEEGTATVVLALHKDEVEALAPLTLEEIHSILQRMEATLDPSDALPQHLLQRLNPTHEASAP